MTQRSRGGDETQHGRSGGETQDGPGGGENQDGPGGGDMAQDGPGGGEMAQDGRGGGDMAQPRGRAIRRIDLPMSDLLCIELRRSPPKHLLLSASNGSVGATLSDRVRGLPATTFVTQLRKHLVGGAITALRASHNMLEFEVRTHEASLHVIGQAKKSGAAWWLQDHSGRTLVQHGDSGIAASTHGLRELSWSDLPNTATDLFAARVESTKRQLRRALQKSLKRLKRKQSAISTDLEASREASNFRLRGDLLLAHAHLFVKGDTSVKAVDWTTQREIVLDLAKGETPIEAAERLFRKAKKLERSVPIATARLRAVSESIAEIERLLSAAEHAADHEQLQIVWEDASTAGALHGGGSTQRRKERSASPHYRQFTGVGGRHVLVGRSAAGNDALTTRIAAPHDLWLHARGVPGSHVVARLDKNETCPPELLLDAATLAAHFSSLKGEPTVDVLYTQRRYVRKRRGSAPGSVTLEREKVIALQIEPQRLQRLLATGKANRA